MRAFRERHHGFTLIELLIVIAVIAILAALAIPNLLGSRKAANETSAISTLRTIMSQEELYKSRNLGGDNGYGTVADLVGKNLITFAKTPSDFSATDSSTWTADLEWEKSGYYFKSAAFNDTNLPKTTSWVVVAYPVDPTNTGDRSFVASSETIIRQVDGDDPADAKTKAQAITTVAGAKAAGNAIE